MTGLTALRRRDASAATPAPATRTRVGPRVRPVSRAGLVVAAWFFLASITPSLVPRSWWMQAAAGGVCVAYGYGCGVAAGWVARRVAGWVGLQVGVSAGAARWLPRVGWSLLVVVLAAVSVWSLSWQGETARLVGLPRPGAWAGLLGVAGSLLVAALLVAAVRGLRWLIARASRAAQRFLPRMLAVPLAVLLIGGLILVLTQDVLYGGFLDYTAAKAATVNASTPDGRTAPVSPLRSGGPGSAEAWDGLGRNGQGFVADGSTAAAITAATGQPAIEPIRVYAGKRPGRSIEQTADAVVAELHRTGAFEREVLAVMTTTGRGWVDEWSASSIEYLSGGDSAIAAMQYSDLPSFVALLSDRRTPATAGRVLFDRVHAAWSKLPAADRPRLVVGGESLGAYGGHAAFSGPQDMLNTVDAAVWVGTPNFTPIWRSLTDARQGGSPEVAPVVDNGSHVRFVTRPADLTHDVHGRRLGRWVSPRIVYAQHPSDPISWWNPTLLDTEPTWIREQAGHDAGEMRWASFVTFFQLTTDLLIANSTPPGHGHRYQDELVPAWAGALGHNPAADYTPIQDAIRRDFRPI